MIDSKKRIEEILHRPIKTFINFLDAMESIDDGTNENGIRKQVNGIMGNYHNIYYKGKKVLFFDSDVLGSTSPPLEEAHLSKEWMNKALDIAIKQRIDRERETEIEEGKNFTIDY